MSGTISVVIDGPLDDDARGHGKTAEGADAVLTGVLPGETVQATIVHTSSRGRMFGRATAVDEASDDRVDARCAHFLDCGGCDLLHASLVAQHAFKRHQVAEALGVPLEQVDPVVASPNTDGYRAFAKLVVGRDGVLGSYRARSHDVVDMTGCLVHAPVVEKIIEHARAHITKATALRYLLVRASMAQSLAVVTLVARSEMARGIEDLARQLASLDEVSRVLLDVNDSDGDALLSTDDPIVLYGGPAPVERIGAIEQSLDGAGFSQVNPGAAAELYALVIEAAKPSGRRVADLYAGSGGIACSLAAAGAVEVTAVEANAGAARAAEASTNADTVRVINASVEVAIEGLPAVDAVVLNPPRKGASRQVIEAIAALAPLDVVYVSCNPKTLARDVDLLSSLVQVDVQRITPVDLFPHTRHVETVLSMRLDPRSS